MTRKFTFPALIAMLLTMAFATVSPVVAQTATPSVEDQLNQLTSDVTIFGRNYEGDLTAAPVDGEAQPVMSILQVYVLDDTETAEAAFPLIQQLMQEQLEVIIKTGFETVPVEELGNNAILSTAEISQMGVSITVGLYLVQDENLIYIAAAVAMSGPAETIALDFLNFMLDNEPGDLEAVEFTKEGGSTGGYFDVMPTASDADTLHGMTPAEDMYEN